MNVERTGVASQFPSSPTRASGAVWRAAIFYIAAAALFLRFYDLPLKPLHHDEGVNTLLLVKVVKPPHLFQYDPANYHGPTLFYAAWVSTFIFGLTTFAIRFVTALAGLVAVLLLLSLRKEIGAVGAISAASWLALSPGAVYYSRYFIHEMLLVCLTLATVVALAAWLREKRLRYLIVSAACAGLMFATKETAIISAVVLVGAALGATWLMEARAIWGGSPQPKQRRPGLEFVALTSRSTAQALRNHSPNWIWMLVAVGVVLVASLLFYTSFFSRWTGALDAVRTYAIWTRTGTAAHTSPWYTYLAWLFEAELPVLILGGAGVAVALWKPHNPFAVFIALWALGILAAYSLIPYKTPWLTLNIVVPLAIAAGYACEFAWRRWSVVTRGSAVVGATVLAFLAAYQTLTLTFVRYDDERHAYVYAHTSRELLSLVNEVHRLEAWNPGSSIAVTSPEHFPLSWYLRQYGVGYYGRPVVTGDPLVIASDKQQSALERSLGKQYERVGTYRLRPGVQLVLYARRDLRRVETRAQELLSLLK